MIRGGVLAAVAAAAVALVPGGAPGATFWQEPPGVVVVPCGVTKAWPNPSRMGVWKVVSWR